VHITSTGHTVTVDADPKVLAVGVPRGLGPRFADSSTPGMVENVRRVASPEALDEALRQGGWDVVVEERGAGSIDPTSALTVLRERVPRVPVLFLNTWTAAPPVTGKRVRANAGLIVDSQGAVRSVGGDTERLLGRSGRDLLGYPFASLFLPKQYPSVVEVRAKSQVWVGRVAGPKMVHMSDTAGRERQVFAWAQDLEWLLGLRGTLMYFRPLKR